MSEKIFYFLTTNQKEELREHLVSIEYPNNWDDWIYDQLKSMVLTSKTHLDNAELVIIKGMQQFKIPLDVKKIEKIKVKRNKTYKKDGEKSVFVCGQLLMEGLSNAYKLENFLSNKEKTKFASSLEQFVNDFINNKISAVILQNYDKKLDDERNLLKKEKENKKKPDKE